MKADRTADGSSTARNTKVCQNYLSVLPLVLFFRHALKSLANKANAAAKPEQFGIYSQGHEKLLTLERARVIHRPRLSKKPHMMGNYLPVNHFPIR